MSAAIRLSVVYVQYDPQRYGGALERLMTLLSSLEGVEATLVIVDNARPGRWSHRITPHLVLVGGDNSQREFTGFESGVDFVRAEPEPPDVVALVTEAFLAYGADYLDYIDGQTVRYCHELEACIGWVDRFDTPVRALRYGYQHWLRTSFVFIPSSVLSRLQPLSTPIPEAQIFSDRASQPFRDQGAIDDRLAQQLLAWLTTEETTVQREDAWHSRFTLSDQTFELFRQKVSAILREQLLSARLQGDGIPCFDFRLTARLAAKGVRAPKLEEILPWQWMGWRDADPTRPLRYDFDAWHHPKELVHGDACEIILHGWVAGEPRVEEVFVDLGTHISLREPCDRLRPEIRDVFPEVQDDYCGFEVRGQLGGLTPGAYPICFRVPSPHSRVVELGVVQVLPKCHFEAQRVFIPTSTCLEEQLPIRIEGSLCTSYALLSIDALWNGSTPTHDNQSFEIRREPSGLIFYDIVFTAVVDLDPLLPQQHLELSFNCDQETAGSWRQSTAIALDQTPPHVMSIRHVGAWNPQSGTTPVHLKGAVLSNSIAEQEEVQLCLSRDDLPLARLPLEYSELGLGGRLGWFELRREMTHIEPGIANFSLALEGPGTTQIVFARWQARVEASQPKVWVDQASTQPPESPGVAPLVRLEGWVEGHRGIDALELTVDGLPLANFELTRLRTDLTNHRGDPLSRRQGFFFEQRLPIGPGPHLLALHHGSPGGPHDPSGRGAGAADRLSLWQKTLDFAEPTSEVFRIDCDTLAALADTQDCHFHTSIELTGTVDTELDSVRATLFVDHRAVDRQSVEADGDFALRAVPRSSGNLTLRVVFDAGHRTLFDTGPMEASFDAAPDLDSLIPGINRFLDAFAIEGRLGLGSTDHLVPLLVGGWFDGDRNAEPGSTHKLAAAAIGRISQVLEAPTPFGSTPTSPAPRILTTGVSSGKRLRVLFPSWGVPCLRHGGGAWMVTLLRELSKSHDITVIYCYSEHESTWIEDARAYADRLIGVPRTYGPTPRSEDEYGEDYMLGEDLVLSYLYREYVPELHRAIEAELHNQSYDIVDYQYTAMFPHVSDHPTPRVMTVFEEPFSAYLANYSAERIPDRQKLARLRGLMQRFYLSTVALPSSFKHLVAVTEEDAAFLRRYQDPAQPSAHVHVNGIGIDIATTPELAATSQQNRAPNGSTRKNQQLVFLGNYRHPPSVDAVRYLAHRIMPRLLAHHPQLELVVVGADPTPEILKLAEQPHIRVTGFVDDYRPYLESSTAFVAPLFTGSGMRVKILEAMACGVPVVATRLAMHGTQAVDGEHFFQAESASDFADRCLHCLESPQHAMQIGRQGKQLIAEQHSAKAMAAGREAIWRHAIEDWRSETPPIRLLEGSTS